jgi:hypothetical protein
MPGGIAMVLVPDLEDVRPTEEVLYKPEADLTAGYNSITEILGRFPSFRTWPIIAASSKKRSKAH